MTRKGIIALLLASMTLGASAVSCGEAQKPEDTKPAESSGTETEAVTEAPEVKDIWHGLEQKDYGEKEFNVLLRTHVASDFWTETQTGEEFNDAVYQRNSLVEERYNIKINAILKDCAWVDVDQWKKDVTASIQAADGAYDMIECYAAIVGSLAMKNLFCNLYDIPNLRLTEEWWSEKALKTMTVNGKYYGAAGDFSTNMWDELQVMFFSKKIAADIDLESPYTLVKNGKWTYDKFHESIKGVYQDLDGDTKASEGDRWGAICWDSLALENFHNSFGLNFIKVGDNGEYELNNYNDDVVSIYEKAMELAWNNPDFFYMNYDYGDGETANQVLSRTMFEEDRALFLFDVLGGAKQLRTMKSDFGVIPVPKKDEAQEDYLTTSRDGRSMLTIPTDVKDPAMAGMISEAFCVSGHEVIVPAYIQSVLEGRIARDPECVEMMNLIRSSLVLCFPSEFGETIYHAGSLVRNCVMLKQEISSLYAQNQKSYETCFKKIMDFYNKTEE